MKKVLITGASGSVGSETVKEILKRNNYDVIISDIDNKYNRNKLKGYSNECLIKYCDITNYEEVKELVKDVDFIIHLAGIIPPLAEVNKKLAFKVNLEGTNNLIKAIEELKQQTFLLFTSSVVVYGDRLNTPSIKVTDSLDLKNKSAYAQSKIEAEKIIEESSINYTIFRLTSIVGLESSKADPIMFEVPLDTVQEICTTFDTARALVNAIEKTDILNKNIYNLSGGVKCRVTYRDNLKRMFTINGLDLKYFDESLFKTSGYFCNSFEDANVLNDILDFQKDTVEDYFKMIEAKVKPIQKILMKFIGKKAMIEMMKMSPLNKK